MCLFENLLFLNPFWVFKLIFMDFQGKNRWNCLKIDFFRLLLQRHLFENQLQVSYLSNPITNIVIYSIPY